MTPPIVSPFRISLIILLEGFVTISVEILAIRQLLPEVGSNIIITSLIIGVFLLFLAYGYQAGGRKQGNLFKSLQRNFLLAAIGIGLGLSFIFIDAFFLMGRYLHMNLLWILVIYLLLIIAPVVYFLGQTVPITMNLLPSQSVGSLGGKVLHLSTIGSFLGAVLTTLLLMNLLGVAWTIIVNYLILAALILLITPPPRLLIMISLLFLVGCFVYTVNRNMESHFFVATTPYGNYAIFKGQAHGQSGTKLEINNSASSFITAEKKGYPYIEKIKDILFKQLALKNKDILILGAGGFTLSAENTYSNRFTYVDIEPRIYPIVQQHFLKQIHGDFIAADARQYVREHPHSYDVIVSDTFSNIASIPSQLLTVQYFLDLKNALKPNGIAIFNILASPFLNSTYAKRVDNTLRAAFGSCMLAPLNFKGQGVGNNIYICQDNKESQDKTIYTDNLNRSNLDVFFQ